MNTPTTNFRRILRNAALGLGLAAVVGGTAVAPAMAADYWHQDRRDVREHVYREHADREHAYREHERVAPRYAYAAPVYHYTPAPAYVPPSLNFGFTIR